MALPPIEKAPIIAQGHSGSGIAGQHFEERKRGGQERFEIAQKKRIEAAPFGCQSQTPIDNSIATESTNYRRGLQEN
jgi:hypothetical protein